MAPAADRVAVAVGILVAFEALEDVVAVAVTGFTGQSGGAIRAHATAAQEHDQRFAVDLALQFGQEMRIAHSPRVLVPFDLDGIGNAPDPVPFGAGPHIDELGAGSQVQQVECFLRRQCPLIGQAQCLGTVVGKIEDLCQFSHGLVLAKFLLQQYKVHHMRHSHHTPTPVNASIAERAVEAQHATWVSVVVNLLMTLLQLAVGWLAHSQSLVAHGLHSFSDLLSDFLVIYASRQSAQPADPEHPYGHARVETAATLLLGASLMLVGGGILWQSGMRLQHVEALVAVELSALWVAIGTVLAKEGLYRYLIRVAERQRSQLLTANALHTRADAASALVVVVGIGGALLGWPFLDLLAAALMGFMILRMGLELSWGALKELIDTGLDEAQVDAIRRTLRSTPGVRGLHELRTRRMAHQALVDAHVQVDARISVSEGHRIAEAARLRVLREHSEVLDVLVHIDPENDANRELSASRLPSREALLQELRPMLVDFPAPEKVVLHYLGGRVEVELFLPSEFFVNGDALARMTGVLAERVATHPGIGRISLHSSFAPK